MNILLLNWRDIGHPKAGGAELVTMEHAKAWVRAGHHVTWLTGKYKGVGAKENIDGVEIVRIGNSITLHLLVPFYLLAKASQFDVVVDEIHGIPFFSTLFTRKPVVVFVHEVAGEIWNYMYPFPINVIGKKMESWCFHFYRHSLFWVDAPSTIDELVAEGLERTQCTAIPCPIVKNVQIKNDVVKEKKPTYIFVSRIVRMKGIEEVIKAFSFIVKEQENAQLWIVGNGEDGYLRILNQMIREYGVEKHVVFYGKVSEESKYELMGRAHILLHASVKEGWGLVVLESASVLTPAVVYTVGGLKDVVKNGNTGVVIHNNSPHEMAGEAIRLYSDSKRYQLYQNNGKVWASSLKWNEVTKKSLQLLVKSLKV
jgi:glycosyltransferase involved in cell wall biosynthesis